MRKVNELVREVVADAVTDLKDPRIGFLTITGAETSPDLRHAVVFYSVRDAGTCSLILRYMAGCVNVGSSISL